MNKLVVALLLVLLSLSAAHAAGPATQFEADVVSQTADKPAIQGRIYVDNGRMRIDTVVQGSNANMIIRPDKDVMYMVVRGSRTFRELPLPDVNKHNAYAAQATRTLIGTEEARGVVCDKYRVVNGPQTFLFWVKKGTDIPVRMETADGRTHVEYSNVKRVAPPKGTFDVPAGFKKI